jgi:hypothetical protein
MTQILDVPIPFMMDAGYTNCIKILNKRSVDTPLNRDTPLKRDISLQRDTPLKRCPMILLLYSKISNDTEKQKCLEDGLIVPENDDDIIFLIKHISNDHFKIQGMKNISTVLETKGTFKMSNLTLLDIIKQIKGDNFKVDLVQVIKNTNYNGTDIFNIIECFESPVYKTDAIKKLSECSCITSMSLEQKHKILRQIPSSFGEQVSKMVGVDFKTSPKDMFLGINDEDDDSSELVSNMKHISFDNHRYDYFERMMTISPLLGVHQDFTDEILSILKVFNFDEYRIKTLDVIMKDVNRMIENEADIKKRESIAGQMRCYRSDVVNTFLWNDGKEHAKKVIDEMSV